MNLFTKENIPVLIVRTNDMLKTVRNMFRRNEIPLIKRLRHQTLWDLISSVWGEDRKEPETMREGQEKTDLAAELVPPKAIGK